MVQLNSKYHPDYIEALKAWDDAMREASVIDKNSRETENSGKVYYLTPTDEFLLEKLRDATDHLREAHKKYFGD